MAADIYRMVSAGFGWEDIAVRLEQRGFIQRKDWPAIRRYVLGIRADVLPRKIAP